MAVNPDAGKPNQKVPVTGGVGGDLSVPPSPPAPPKKESGPPSAKAAIAAILKLKSARAYRGSTGLLNIAQARYVDPVALLLAAIATGTANTPAALTSLANRMREGAKNYGTLDDWLRSVNARPIAAQVLKAAKVPNYVYTSPQRPPQSATTSVERAGAKDALTDPYVTVKNGKFTTTKNEAEATKSFGAAVRMSDFQRAQSHYNDYFTKYIGRKATATEIIGIIRKGLSETAVQMMLSKDPAFKRGSVWQAQAPAILGYAKSMMGENWKADPDFVRKAIVNNWSEGTLRAKLRARPEYLQGPEFRQNVSALQNVYSSIQGRPDEAAMQGIKEAALGGWSSDQYAAYLRNDPNYVKGQEYKSKALSFLDALGLVTGEQTTIQGIQGLGQPKPVPGIEGTTPHSDRLSPTSPTVVQQAAGKSTPKGPAPQKTKAKPSPYPVGYRPF